MPNIYNKIEIIYYKQSVCIITIMSVNQICYFCDEVYPDPSCFITNYDNLWICDLCENFIPIDYNICRENGECCVCLEEQILVNLPTCRHKVCLKCCKTIYFGSTTDVRPLHWREMDNKFPDWPVNESEEYNEDDENEKQEEYDFFEDIYFNYKKKTYEELIKFRNGLMSDRLEWMNTEEFINYENKRFRYNINFEKVDKEGNEWNNKKIQGNGTCPLCRAKPI